MDNGQGNSGDVERRQGERRKGDRRSVAGAERLGEQVRDVLLLQMSLKELQGDRKRRKRRKLQRLLRR